MFVLFYFSSSPSLILLCLAPFYQFLKLNIFSGRFWSFSLVLILQMVVILVSALLLMLHGWIGRLPYLFSLF